ncbi:hypothetical protein T492DRAFT_846975 [Pavlovales sp. CCMP2436]|nr:hypothetical protein T492DRAFT_846975 [Pavlovales sp. CCMP2436]
MHLLGRGGGGGLCARAGGWGVGTVCARALAGAAKRVRTDGASKVVKADRVRVPRVNDAGVSAAGTATPYDMPPLPPRPKVLLPAADPRQEYENIVRRYTTFVDPPLTMLWSLLMGASSFEDGELAVSAYRMFVRKDRPTPNKLTTALLLKSTLRTRNFEPVLAMLEASKWNGLFPEEPILQAMQSALYQDKDWVRVERLWRVRVELGLVSCTDAIRTAQCALIAQGKLQGALKMLSPDKSLTASLVRSPNYANLLLACADTGKHAPLAQIAWAQPPLPLCHSVVI